MQAKYFNRIAKWAARKMVKDIGLSASYIANTYFIPYFREEFKSHSRVEFENTNCLEFNDENEGIRSGWKSHTSKISWSFETSDYKPAKQRNADYLVFRYTPVKGRGCTIRIVHKLK